MASLDTQTTFQCADMEEPVTRKKVVFGKSEPLITSLNLTEDLRDKNGTDLQANASLSKKK